MPLDEGLSVPGSWVHWIVVLEGFGGWENRFTHFFSSLSMQALSFERVVTDLVFLGNQPFQNLGGIRPGKFFLNLLGFLNVEVNFKLC